MPHTNKFIFITESDVKITTDLNELKEMIDSDKGAVLRIECGDDGKLLSSSIINQSGIFEPTYTLRAGDDTAHPVVELHAKILKFRGVNSEKVVSAEASALAFKDYSGPKKKAD